MSLINDALRKAKQAQQQTPESDSPSLPLRPIEPSQPARHGLGLLVPAGSAIAALLLLFFLWQFSRANSAKTVVIAKANSPAPPAAVASSPPAPAARPEPPPAKLPAAAAEPAPATSNSLAPATNGTAADAVASVSTNEPPGASTNEALAVAPAPPKPAPLRLQGLFLSSTRPSALVSGKTLFIGDRLGDFRLAALDQQTATLVSSDKTNVLTLGQ